MRTFKALLIPCALTAGIAACGDDAPTNPTTTTDGTGGTGGDGASDGTGAMGGAGGSTGGGGMGGQPGDFDAPYEWESKFVPGEHAVAHSGQTLRHVLIESMDIYIGNLTDQIDGNMNPPQSEAEAIAALEYYYLFDSASSGGDPHGVETMPDPLQATFGDIAGDKDLQSKMAGNDDTTDHEDWDDGTSFVGWNDASVLDGGDVSSPEKLLYSMFNKLAEQVNTRVNDFNNFPTEPGTTDTIEAVYVTPDGLDLQQLIQKFLLMGVAYSQGTDDYLGADVADKGLLTSNAQDGSDPYSTLGHQWDEAYGYFGAAHDYSLYTDEEIAGKGGRDDWQGYHDTSGDGAIDLMREYNWGASTNAAKRDLGSQPSAMTDYTDQAFSAFVDGRTLILEAGETLTSQEQSDLESHALEAIDAWDRAIAATVIHYINDTIADTEAIGTASYDFYAHAKHFSELKGFALGLQFNPQSPISDGDFTTFHTLVGDAPVLADDTAAQQTAYVQALENARTMLANAYGFDSANVQGW